MMHEHHHGPQPHPSPSHRGNHHRSMLADFWQRFWVCLLFTIPILILSPSIQKGPSLGTSFRFKGDAWVLFLLASAVFFYGGHPFLKGLGQELREKQPGMMTLIAIAISTAYLYSAAVVFGLRGEVFFWELATLVDIMLLGHWIEMRSALAASRALEALARIMPAIAHRLKPGGETEDVPLEALRPGDRVIIKPGEKIPADGEVVEGETSVDESLLTGESQPVSKAAGARVIGGSVNSEGSVTAVVRKTGPDSFLAQVLRLVREAQASKSLSQRLADRAAVWLTGIALAAGALTLAAWLLVGHRGLDFALERTVTVMVIACPHALGLAVPLVVAVSTALAAGHGLLIRNRAAFEQGRRIQAMLFDKTGTLTEGRFGVTDTLVLARDIDAACLLKYAVAVEARSEHPIARGIAASAPHAWPVHDFRALPGRGAEGRVNGRAVQVVSPGFLRDQKIAVSDPRIGAASGQGKTVVFVVIDGDVKGAIALADLVRPESKAAVAKLQRMGIRCMMLTGDNRQVAAWVAQQLGLDEYFAEVLPQEKAAKVREVQQRGLAVAMTGDGVNDAPALAQADLGIAIGAGTDVAMESADVVLVRNNPADVITILKLARATYRKMAQNLAWATGYNAFAMPLAAGVLAGAGILLTPAVGAALMSLSTIIVAVNARFLRLP